MKHIASLLAVTFVMLCAFLFSTFSYAQGSIELAPLRLVLSDSVTISTLIVKNRSSTPTLVQLELLSWSQKNNQDVLEPTRDVLISPPVFTIPANGEQILRAVLRRKADANKELCYRLFVREVQDQSQPVTKGSVNVLLNISIPIFIEPAAKASSKLLWHATTDVHKVNIKLVNDGLQHIQIKSFQLSNDSANPISQNVMRYVLPGSSTEWTFENKDAPFKSPLTLHVITDNGDLRETITLEQP